MTRMRRNGIVATASTVALPATALAHSGHHDGAEGLSHALTQPDHLLALAAAGAAIALAGYAVRRIKKGGDGAARHHPTFLARATGQGRVAPDVRTRGDR